MDKAPGVVADNSRDGLVSQLHEVWQALGALGDSTDDREWRLETPCPGWPVSAQYAHVIGTESMLLGRPNPEVEMPEETPAHVLNQIGGFNEVWVTALDPKPRAEVMEAYREVIGAREKELAGKTEADFDAPSWTPVGQADYRRFMQVRVFDCWVHLLDILDALGRSGSEEGAAAEQSIDEIVRAAGFIVGKKAGAPAGSGVRFELTGPVKRTVDVDVADRARVVGSLDREPTVTLSMSSSAYSRLSCGRVTPASVLDGAFGGVSFAGDEALGRRVVEHLAFTI